MHESLSVGVASRSRCLFFFDLGDEKRAFGNVQEAKPIHPKCTLFVHSQPGLRGRVLRKFLSKTALAAIGDSCP